MSTELYLGRKRPNFPYETSCRSNGVTAFNPKRPLSPLSSSPRHFKRPRFAAEENAQKTSSVPAPAPAPAPKASKAVDFSNPTAVQDFLDGLDRGRFGSVTKDIEALVARKMRTLSPYFKMYPELVDKFIAVECKGVSKLEEREVTRLASGGSGSNVIDLEDEFVPASAPRMPVPVVTIDLDSDEEEDKGNDSTPSYNFQSVFSVPPGGVGGGVSFVKEIEVQGGANMVVLEEKTLTVEPTVETKNDEIQRDKGVYVGVEEDDDPQDSPVDDGLDDIWNEMSMGLEVSKDVAVDPSLDEQAAEDEESCDHSYVLKDDIGYVCRVCGVIDKGIDTIFEFQYGKVKRSSRTYLPDSRSSKDRESVGIGGLNLSGDDDITVSKVYAHPRHTKKMKPHQVEGFEFLVSNLVGENPGGCILAHAPGSGKTFMIISFVQSFLAKYPNARPLVILPKGILSTWKKEFQIWQVEDIPLFDFYTVKADNRYQQLDVLKQWVETKSILFLGYKQFSTIICDLEDSEVSSSCREILLKAPSILIMDEGHTPRNENTDMLQSIAKIQTPRKVVLSGTLYQNHVKEVFNILNLVRPKFLKMEKSRPIVKRIMAKVDISGRKNFKSSGDGSFFDIVEDTLQRDKDFRRKVSVIHDLREMTSKVLHYYKGDFLDELPGLLDLTVVLNLSPNQKRELGHIKKMSRKFKASSVGSAVYLHPKLVTFSDTGIPSDAKMDELLESLDVEEGVKAKFFLNILSLCEAAKEKLLVFSQYLIPLKFLERLVMRERGWSLGKEIFVISGESSHDQREWAMEHFNNSPSARVFFGSIKACGEGISLVGASRIIILDVHLNPSVTRQAIGRAFRPGQKNRVVTYRLIASDSPEEEDHQTCFKKELISKMWFEWNEYCGYKDFEVLTVDIKDCDDEFLESSSLLSQDVKLLYKR